MEGSLGISRSEDAKLYLQMPLLRTMRFFAVLQSAVLQSPKATQLNSNYLYISPLTEIPAHILKGQKVAVASCNPMFNW